MALGSIIAASLHKGNLKDLFEAKFIQDEPQPPLDPKNYYVRASGFADMCPREEVLCTTHNVTRKRKFDANTNLIFLHGTSLHWGVQNHLLAKLGLLNGMWRCNLCGKLHGGPLLEETTAPFAAKIGPRPPKCSKCGVEANGNTFTYEEWFFKDEELRLTGHPDGFISLPGHNGMGIFELKSVGGRKAWQIKHTPDVGHVVQAHIYMMFTGFSWMQLLYWIKAENGLPALVEHHIERDQEIITNIRTQLIVLRHGMETGELPQRICQNSTCPRAKNCSTTKLCFA